MQKILIFIVIFLVNTVVFSQIKLNDKVLNTDGTTTNGRLLNDSINNSDEIKVELDGTTHFTDYKIISFAKDTTILDTTLSLKKERVFNYIRKNNFELMPLHNLGQNFNHLAYDFSNAEIFPEMGMNAKRFNYYKTEDVNYYRVPTPTSELFFQTGIQQGQILNSLLTMNVNPQLNISIEFKGLRSLGDYRNALSSHQNLRMTASYTSKSHKYVLRTHYAGQKLINQENGGLTDESILLYTSDNSEYKQRERLDTQFTDAESKLRTRRYYLEQGYNLWYHSTDSLKKESYWQIGHEMTYNRQFYIYEQSKANDFFGESYSTKVSDSTYYLKMEQGAFTELKAPWILGKLRFKVNYTNYDYGYNSVLFLNSGTIPAYLKGHNTAAQADWNAQFKTFGLKASAGTIFEGDFTGNYLSGIATFSKDSLFTIKATALVKSQSPQLSAQLYQSAYIDYNWYNHLDNEQTRYLGFAFLSDKWVDAEASLTQKDFYTYFDENSQPNQYNGSLAYSKIKIHKELKFWKLALDNTFLYQKVLQGESVLHVPEIITENTFYFSDDVFKRKPMYLQTGFTVKYFTSYFADEFNPLINEFRLQNETEIGNYPLLEFFANARVQRTRLYFKLENLGSLWDGGKYFVTPSQPYRDFKVRFGLIWNFFI